MNAEQLRAAAAHHELMWRMYGEQAHYNAWQHLLRALASPEAQPVAPKAQEKISRTHHHHLKGKPSPLKGRKLTPEHIAKLKGPKTEAQKAAMRGVPKSDTSKMGKYVRTPEIREAAAKKSTGRPKNQAERVKIARAKIGPKNPKYRTYVFGAVHPVHGTFYGDRLKLHQMFPNELPLQELRKLALGEYPVYKGWRLVQPAVIR